MINEFGPKSNYKLVEKRGEYYIYRWNYRPQIDEEGHETDYAYWSEDWVKYKPTLSQLEHNIMGFIDQETDYKKINGFVWEVPGQEEVPYEDKEFINPTFDVETMLNLIAVYNLTVQLNGANLPFVMKSGTNENPHYHSFNTLEEFTAFYLAAMQFEAEVYAEGWQKKDSIVWADYEKALEDLDAEETQEPSEE